jgi:hypothetical protein
MIDFETPILADLNTALGSRKGPLANALVEWFAGVKKVPVPDLIARVQKYEVRLRDLADSIHFILAEDKPRLVATGLSTDTLRELRFGTMWFIGTDDFESVVIAHL